jgi:uncharacterized membrane protein YoaK (UPF0700 family)
VKSYAANFAILGQFLRKESEMSETIWLDFAIPVISIIIGVTLGLMIAAIMRANDK